jgi:N-acetylmuramic acid 6-phosphate etherase
VMDRLSTEQPDASSRDLDLLPVERVLQIINTADAQVAGCVTPEIPRIARAVQAISDRLLKRGHLFYIGAGTSGRLGALDAAEIPPTFGVPPELVRFIIAGGERALTRSVEAAEDDPGSGARDLQAAGVSAADAVIGISASGRTPYVLGAIDAARKIGALTCGISCTPDSELSRMVEYPIAPVTGPEILTGSTRMRAGTATKMVLNMISTAVMVRLGHVYGNLMVNVHPSNQKLANRARRMVELAARVNADQAAELLNAAGSVRTAIVMAKKQVGREEAERLLAAAGGRLREALGEAGGG